MAEPSGKLIPHKTKDGRSRIQMGAIDGTVWLTQAQIAELFDTGIPNINKHIALKQLGFAAEQLEEGQ
ncbi:hypothetical protein AB0M50_25135 [Nonomuraea fuscirosea]|uniref:hypothetical protein n=1 Tax=Nonomuraea fuscirosea TaxID=1291556 RepID=UPI00343E7E41